ncbi:glutaredoxin family protein [Xylanimonas cellulosilytica]|uniref:glutaredoxin family protein n=1 Tax=Xylanimonas cellulosilytica TaxID=186189 RepID=UPI0005A0C8BF|nr:glutaredoxin family protein [Xylanimonas cellulosilytica]
MDRPPTHTDRVVLFTRAGCHLCDDAREVVARVCGTLGETWHEVDVDTGPESATLRDRYGDYVPVVEVDGVQQGFWQVDGDRLARRLTGRR